MRFRKKTQKKTNQVVLQVRFVRHKSISGVSTGYRRFFQNPSQPNNDGRNQAIGMLNADMSATVVSRTSVVLERLSSVYGDDSVPRSGRHV